MHERRRPSLDELLSDPRRAAEVPAEEVPALVCGLGALLAVLAPRLSLPDRTPELSEDRLLTADQAAEVLGLPAQYLYRHPFPFEVRVGRHVRFSAEGIQRWIRARRGRNT